MKYKYGISLEEYEEMSIAQAHVCAICGFAENGKRLAVDHDHDTDAIRGLLCSPCNLGIGSFRDDPERLTKAAQYLKDHK